MAAGTLPLAAYVRRSMRADDALRLLLYIAVAAGFAACLSLSYINWFPSTDTLFGVS